MSPCWRQCQVDSPSEHSAKIILSHCSFLASRMPDLNVMTKPTHRKANSLFVSDRWLAPPSTSHVWMPDTAFVLRFTQLVSNMVFSGRELMKCTWKEYSVKLNKCYLRSWFFSSLKNITKPITKMVSTLGSTRAAWRDGGPSLWRSRSDVYKLM